MYQGESRAYSLSVIVITKNEEDRIARCLASVEAIADEIIVLDSGSEDKTMAIAGQFTEDIYETDWPGYGKQKQRALDKASCEWVLSLDADEELSDELRDEIDVLLSGEPQCSAYKMRWAEILLGKQLNYGSRARYVLRLFKRDVAVFSDWIVHEKIVLQDGEKTGALNARLKHYSVRDFDQLMHKYTLYASLATKRKIEKGTYGGGIVGASFRAAFVFFHIYILRLGFLDGSAGLLMAVMQSQYTFNKYAGLWFLKKTNLKK